MLRRFGSARAALEMVPQLARRGERSKTVTPVTRAEAEAEFAALQRLGGRLLSERASGNRSRAADPDRPRAGGVAR
jgi:hypothetical protein